MTANKGVYWGVLGIILVALLVQMYATPQKESVPEVKQVTGYATVPQCEETSSSVNACPPTVKKKECYPIPSSPYGPGTTEEVEVECRANTQVGSTMQVTITYTLIPGLPSGIITRTFTGTVITPPSPVQPSPSGQAIYTCIVRVTHTDSVSSQDLEKMACDAATSNAKGKLGLDPATAGAGTAAKQAKIDNMCKDFAASAGVTSGCSGNLRPKPTTGSCYKSNSEMCVCMEWHCKWDSKKVEIGVKTQDQAQGSGE